jgi:hypothetical protein
MNIFIVHLIYDPSVVEYVKWSLRITAKSNPSASIFLLTTSPELQLALSSFRIESLNILVLPECFVRLVNSRVEDVFYHDNLNPRWFDVACFTRHLVVSEFLLGNCLDYREIGLSASCNSAFLAICDSDIGVTSDLSTLTSGDQPLVGDVASLGDSSIYFSVWKTASFLKFSCFDVLNEYFDYAASIQAPRCSDMTWYQHAIRSGSLVFSPFSVQFGVPLDPLRDTIFHFGLWLDCLPRLMHDGKSVDINTVIQSWICSRGPWESEQFLKDAFDSSFLQRFVRKSFTGQSIACLDVEYLYEMRSRFEALDNYCLLTAPVAPVIGQHVTFYVDKCAQASSPLLESLPISYIHLQGMGKKLAGSLRYLLD